MVVSLVVVCRSREKKTTTGDITENNKPANAHSLAPFFSNLHPASSATEYGDSGAAVRHAPERRPRILRIWQFTLQATKRRKEREGAM